MFLKDRTRLSWRELVISAERRALCATTLFRYLSHYYANKSCTRPITAQRGCGLPQLLRDPARSCASRQVCFHTASESSIAMYIRPQVAAGHDIASEARLSSAEKIAIVANRVWFPGAPSRMKLVITTRFGPVFRQARCYLVVSVTDLTLTVPLIMIRTLHEASCIGKYDLPRYFQDTVLF